MRRGRIALYLARNERELFEKSWALSWVEGNSSWKVFFALATCLSLEIAISLISFASTVLLVSLITGPLLFWCFAINAAAGLQKKYGDKRVNVWTWREASNSVERWQELAEMVMEIFWVMGEALALATPIWKIKSARSSSFIALGLRPDWGMLFRFRCVGANPFACSALVSARLKSIGQESAGNVEGFELWRSEALADWALKPFGRCASVLMLRRPWVSPLSAIRKRSAHGKAAHWIMDMDSRQERECLSAAVSAPSHGFYPALTSGRRL